METKKSGAVTVAAAAVIIALLCAYNLRGGTSDMTGGAVGTESAVSDLPDTSAVTSEMTGPETTEP